MTIRPGRHRAHRRPTRPATTALTVALAGVLLTTPASADPLTVDELSSTDRPAVAVAAPADVEVEFGQLGFTGVTPPPPEPDPVVVSEPAETTAPAPTAEPSPQGTTTTPPTTEPAAPSRSAERAPAPAPEQPVTPAPPAGSGVIGIAAQYVGRPYSLGSTGPSAFDCSGYTQFVFAQAGIDLPRTAAAQQAYATPVSNPQPGDLVFWGSPAYHVGIYAGNGMVYDAGNPGTGVVFRSMFSGVSGYGRVL